MRGSEIYVLNLVAKIIFMRNSSDNNDDINTISSKNFTINAKGGDDVITTNGGDDYIDAGNGNDTVSVIKFKNNLIIYPNYINYYNITKILF